MLIYRNQGAVKEIQFNLDVKPYACVYFPISVACRLHTTLICSHLLVHNGVHNSDDYVLHVCERSLGAVWRNADAAPLPA